MSDYTTNFPPQTYSSSFYINSLVDGEQNILTRTKKTDGEVTKSSPLLDCFISTLQMSKIFNKIEKLTCLWMLLFFLPTNAVKKCKVGDLNRIVTFSSLVEYQANSHSFDPDHSTYRGNIVVFDFKSIDKLVKNSFISFESDNIIKISLNNKGLHTIEDGAFSGLFCLHYLELRHNNISILTTNTFIGLSNLWHLDLSENTFQNHISDYGMAFNKLFNLKVLNISNNLISTLNPNDFLNLTNLEVLDLSHNKISAIPSDIFFYFSSLKKMYLNNNELNDIEPEQWNNLCNLELLNLAGNYLSKFDPSYNFSFINLKNLNISKNYLRYLNVFALKKNLPNLKVIDIRLNCWYCEDLQSIIHELADSKITVVDGVNCSMSKEYYSTTVKPLLSTLSTTTTAENITNTTYDDAPGSIKKIFFQNERMLITSDKILNHILKFQWFLGCLCAVIIIFIVVNISLRIGVCHYLYKTMFGRYQRHMEEDNERLTLFRRSS